MRLFRAIALLFTSILFFQCQKEISSVGPSSPGITLSEPISARLQGNVYNENGQPAQGVTVKVGTQTTTTDATGNFRFTSASLDKKASLVTAEINGYFKAYRVFAATSGTNYLAIKLIKKTLVGTIDAATGGNVSLSNGAKIALPANGVVKASNNSAYTGTVNVYAAYIDPTSEDINQTIPGSFMAEDKSGKRVTLASYGMMAVQLESSSAEKLQIKTGTKATLTTPIPTSALSSAPATIALWSVNEETGIWKEEGTATKNGNVYVGDVSHFSFWNCDIPMNAVVLSVTIKTPNNQPIVFATVRIKRTTGIGQANGWTDSLGQVSGYVPANEILTLEVLDPCGNVAHTQNIGPFTQNTNLGVINVSFSNATLTIGGHVSNCSGGNVTNGYAIIFYNNVVRYGAVDASGNFSVSFIACPNLSATAQVIGYDNSSQQQSSPANVGITLPNTNVGNITACGIASDQYINYTLDGNSFSLLSSNSDSLMAMNDSLGFKWIGGYEPGNATFKSITVFFTATTPTPGTYPMTSVSMNSISTGLLSNTSKVILTSFAALVGQYYEGSFSGAFANGTHTFSGNFRVKRKN
jgi:hypothetical protein